MSDFSTDADVVIVGAGAAGLAAAAFLTETRSDLRITILERMQRLGAKILISGGGRCNVTNVQVTPDDYCGGSRRSVGRVLKAFSAADTVSFFQRLGVDFYEEERGKLFPTTDRARSVLNALVDSVRTRGVDIRTGTCVGGIDCREGMYALDLGAERLTAKVVILSTGGKSVPKTGSDGSGYQLAESLGHTLVPTYPALVPLLLDGEFHKTLSGITHDVELTLHARDQKPTRCRGAMLWTHIGVSGPVVLDISRHWHAAKETGREPKLCLSFFPDRDFAAMEQEIIDSAKLQPGSPIRRLLASRLTTRVTDALLSDIEVDPATRLAELTRGGRRALVHQLVERELPVIDSRGFRFAEATAGGVPLSEVNPSTMESRCSRGLFLAGEVLDVDGRIGGFNFQWAWSSAHVAADGVARFLQGK